MLSKLIGALGLALCTVISQPAAAMVTVQLSGYIYYQTPDTTSTFVIGQEASAWFTFDETAAGETFSPGGVLDPSIRFYRHAPTGGGMTIGDYKVTFSEAARMFVTNNEAGPNGPIDRILFDDFGAIGDPIAGRNLDVVSISFQDNTSTVIDSLDLPTNPATFAAFKGAKASLDWNPYLNAAHRISIDFFSVSIIAVPEPTTWVMMILGIGAVGFAMRRRQKNVTTTVKFA
ncbi:PEPxxWA-CTERM sorting domain-containing protein [Sphingomonas sp. A2-49]|uniref:PEPxxWA-CTERM sorting domain-containing protein n=1 Tax=Sphingomonas sp. A2-49 TaxID=1391375 RepID=UPI0021D2A4D1|nr:PEPxxWA-CTERM sorting domain-containing protein [Sphingomonas sp. A2-49]MCU6455493.1 PEPxxWA-CTERM sorting domain-containing protein [Sphingomonas sp. A2-49]